MAFSVIILLASIESDRRDNISSRLYDVIAYLDDHDSSDVDEDCSDDNHDCSNANHDCSDDDHDSSDDNHDCSDDNHEHV